MKVVTRAYWGPDSPTNDSSPIIYKIDYLPVSEGLMILMRQAAIVGNFEFRLVSIEQNSISFTTEHARISIQADCVGKAPENHYWYVHTFTATVGIEQFGLVRLCADALKAWWPERIAPQELVVDCS